MDQVLGLVTSSGQFKYYYEISVDFGEMVLNWGYADPCGHMKTKKKFFCCMIVYTIYMYYFKYPQKISFVFVNFLFFMRTNISWYL